MKASLKGKYDSSEGKGSATAIVTISAGDVKLGASMTDATITNGTSLSKLAFSVEKPDFFVIGYDVPKKDVSFKFTNTVSVLEKPLNIGYRHKLGDKETTLDGTLVFDSANKLSADYAFGSGNCKLKYSYVHGGTRTFEPCYDLMQNSWDIAVSQKILDNDMFKASYKTSSKVLGLEWSRKSKLNGSFKVSASLNVAEELKMPKLTAESAWDFEI